MKKIAVLIDFTSICEVALEHAAIISRRSLCPLFLVYIAPAEKITDEKQIIERMKSHTHGLDREGIPYAVRIGYGGFFERIDNFLTEIGADFVVVGTHGIKGIADASYGLNILRLIRNMQMPTLIVQGHSQAPLEGYDNALIPVVRGKNVTLPTEAIVAFIQHFQSKLSLLEYAKSDADAGESQRQFEKDMPGSGFRFSYDYEIVSPYVKSYTRSLLQYAEIEDVNLILWTNQLEKSLFDAEDQENLILNRQGIAVLYVP